MDNRCQGCRYRTPQSVGGYGILCQSPDCQCPKWIVKSTLNYGRLQPFVESEKTTDTQREIWKNKLLEELRI
jgi:hypothetical protein